jgi:hypothetical protein
MLDAEMGQQEGLGTPNQALNLLFELCGRLAPGV